MATLIAGCDDPKLNPARFHVAVTEHINAAGRPSWASRCRCRRSGFGTDR
jgi:hypothetical protein